MTTKNVFSFSHRAGARLLAVTGGLCCHLYKYKKTSQKIKMNKTWCFFPNYTERACIKNALKRQIWPPSINHSQRIPWCTSTSDKLQVACGNRNKLQPSKCQGPKVVMSGRSSLSLIVQAGFTQWASWPWRSDAGRTPATWPDRWDSTWRRCWSTTHVCWWTLKDTRRRQMENQNWTKQILLQITKLAGPTDRCNSAAFTKHFLLKWHFKSSWKFQFTFWILPFVSLISSSLFFM